MMINPSKSQIIHNSGNKTPRPPSITINLNNIVVCSEAKLLGVTLTPDLKWDKHITHAIKRASKIAFVLLQMKRAGCNSNILLKYYQATCRSILTYSYPAMCNMSSNLMNSIIKCKRRCLNIVGLRPTVPISSYCDSLCQNLKQKVNNNPNHPLRRLISTHNRSTRSGGLVLPPTRTSRQANSFIKFFS